jgi:hypothetical protein
MATPGDQVPVDRGVESADRRRRKKGAEIFWVAGEDQHRHENRKTLTTKDTKEHKEGASGRACGLALLKPMHLVSPRAEQYMGTFPFSGFRPLCSFVSFVVKFL